MPASRNCASCGAALPGDVRWCGRCYEPVREFTPRAPLHGEVVGELHHDVVTSRWSKGPGTFGPLGRLGITALLVVPPSLIVPAAMGIWPLALWFLLGYSIFAAMVLRDVWKRAPVVGTSKATGRLTARHPVLGRRVPFAGPVLAGVGSLVVLVAALTLWGDASDLVRFLAVAAALAGSFGFVLMWWLEN